MSFVSSKPDPYPTPVDVVVYLISAIMNRVIKRFYCISIAFAKSMFLHTSAKSQGRRSLIFTDKETASLRVYGKAAMII